MNMTNTFSKFLSLSLFGYFGFFNITQVAAAPIELLGVAKDFVETGEDNSLIKDPSLFSLSANGTFSTISEQTNIHAHYRANGANKYKNYTYTGMMRILDDGGGVGVTFYSDYPKSDTYYRLRMYSGNQSFHIEPHPDGDYTLTGTLDTGVIPDVNLWQRFKIVVKSFKKRTTIKAKVWPKGTAEPSAWQVDCEDAGANRIKKGKPGVWSMGTGEKQWKKLKVNLSE